MTSETLAPGLSSTEAARRLQTDGPNTLPEPARPHPGRQLVEQFTHLLALLLWVASGLALLAGMPTLALAIVVVVVLNAIFAFWQEYRADRSAERLRSLLPQRTRVRRDGVPVQVAARDVVRGDLVLLEAGDRVSADMELVRAQSLSADESLVTGESAPVPRAAGDPLMAGSFVVQGVGEALVTATGTSTTLAQVSSLAASATRPPSPLTRQLAKVVRVVAVIAFATGVLLGVTGWVAGLYPTQAFLFGVGVTVALVPEGLLPTVTLSLARGAQQMAEDHALVRRLDAVETLGATTFICTDKTGTLTQNQMAVVQAGRPSAPWTSTLRVRPPTARGCPLGVPMPAPRHRDPRGRAASLAGRCSGAAPGTPRATRWTPRCTASRCAAAGATSGRSPTCVRPYTADRHDELVGARTGRSACWALPKRCSRACARVPEDGAAGGVLDDRSGPAGAGGGHHGVRRRRRRPATVERDLELWGCSASRTRPGPTSSEALARPAGRRTSGWRWSPVTTRARRRPSPARSGCWAPRARWWTGSDLPEDDESWPPCSTARTAPWWPGSRRPTSYGSPGCSGTAGTSWR